MARICINSDQFQIGPSGELQLVPGALGTQQTLVFPTNGSFNKADYPGLARVWVRLVGGGGGSAATTAPVGTTHFFAANGGGGGGGYAESVIQASALAASEPIVVGTGGAAGAIPNGGGGNGNTSSFGTLVIATGGNGSPSQLNGNGFVVEVTTPTLGGIGTAGQVLSEGGSGGSGVRVDSTTGYAGHGGASVLGGAARAIGQGGFSPGQPGLAIGGGASGSTAVNTNPASQPGAAGANGIVIVTLIF